jgi:hypothetical protein
MRIDLLFLGTAVNPNAGVLGSDLVQAGAGGVGGNGVNGGTGGAGRLAGSLGGTPGTNGIS